MGIKINEKKLSKYAIYMIAFLTDNYTFDEIFFLNQAEIMDAILEFGMENDYQENDDFFSLVKNGILDYYELYHYIRARAIAFLSTYFLIVKK